MSDYRRELLEDLDLYCWLTGYQPGYIAAKITGNARFFLRLEQGLGCNADNVQKVKNWFREHMPEMPQFIKDHKKRNTHKTRSSG